MKIRRRHSAGITLVESLIASAVLALAVAAISQAVVAGQMQTYAALHELRATSLAEALLEEIVALPYRDPEGATAVGPDSGENTRAGFDNSDDFHGFTEAAGAVQDVAGAAYPAEYQVYSRSVTAAYGTMTVSGLGDPVPGLTVTVTVTDDAGKTWQITRFIPEPGA